MSKAEKFERPNENTPAFNRGEKTILVVEDDRTHRALMDKILKECGFKTVQAENGIIALSKIEAGQHFDLIIMDWDMPEMDGLETTRKIRARDMELGTAHTPIIAFTARRDSGDQKQCLAAGMDAYLPKDVWMPKWRSTLVDSLQGLIAGHFDLQDFDNAPANTMRDESKKDFDLDAFDLQALEQSATLLKEELAIAVDEYLEDAAAYIRDIKDGLDNGDAEKAARGSHPLKSNSKGFGLTTVSQIAEAINKQTRDGGNLEGVESLLAQLQEAFKRAEKKLRDTIRNAGY